MSILLLLGNNANYLGHSITQMEKSLNWNHSLYKIYCAEKFDNNLTTKNKEYNNHNIKIPFSKSNGISNTINIHNEITKIITTLFHISNELMTTPLRCIYIICDLNCIYSTQIASSIIESIGNHLQFITRHCVGLIPIGGLNGVSNYGAMFYIYSALITGDSLMIRSLVDAVFLLNDFNGNNNSNNSTSLVNLWMPTAADILTCCLAWYRDYDTTTSSVASDTTSSTCGNISGCDFTTLCTTSSNKIVDIRSSLWRRFIPTSHTSTTTTNPATTTTSSSNNYRISNPVSNTNRIHRTHNPKIKGLRDMATNVHALFAVHTTNATGTTTSTMINSNSKSISSNYSSGNSSSNSNSYSAAVGTSITAKVDEKMRSIKQAQLLEMGLQRKTNSSSKTDNNNSNSCNSYSINIRECTAASKDVNASLLYATPGCQWPVLVTNPKNGSNFIHGDIVIMVLQSPFAVETVKVVCERALMLGQRKAFLHYFHTAQRINSINKQYNWNNSQVKGTNTNNINYNTCTNDLTNDESIWCREAVVAAQHVLYKIS